MLSANIYDRAKVFELTAVMKHDVRLVNVIANMLNLIIALVILFMFTPEQYYMKLFIVFVLLIIQNFVNTLSLVNSNVIMAVEHSRSSLLINLKSSILFFRFSFTVIYLSC